MLTPAQEAALNGDEEQWKIEIEKQRNKLIYLASPYNHESSEIREERFTQICHIASSVIKSKKVHIFCPIAHTHPIAQFGLPLGFEYWEEYDSIMISKCNELWIATMRDWTTSLGVSREIQIARSLEIPIKLLDPTSLTLSDYTDYS